MWKVDVSVTAEQSFFLKVLADHIAKQNTDTADVDWNAVAKFARDHQVEAIVYHQCKTFIPEPRHSTLKKANSAAMFYSVNRSAFIASLEKNIADIPHFYVKGAVVSKYYPVPSLRTMGDTDIIAPRERVNDIRAAMLSMGCRDATDAGVDTEVKMYSGELEYEIHGELSYELYAADSKDALKEYFGNYMDRVTDGKLDANVHFIYVLLHLRKHFVGIGVGFRQFYDLAVLIKNDTELDFSVIESDLEKLGLLPFAKTCFAFIERWFGIPSPIKTDALSDVFYEQSTQKIFANGVFGANDESNVSNSSVFVSAGKKHPLLYRIKRFFTALFPPYSKLSKETDAYPFLNGRPYLLPAAWIKRISSQLKTHGKSRVGKSVKKYFPSKESVREREDMLSKWGLI